jgi:hypothetical protein
MASRKLPPGGQGQGKPGLALSVARTNLTWLSRAIEDGTPLEAAIKEVYSMEIYGFAGDLRVLLKEVAR